MADIEQMVMIYIEDSGLIEEKVKDIWQSMRLNWDKLLYEGHGRQTGTLLGDLLLNTTYTYNNLAGTVEGRYTVEYGKYVDKGHHSFKGYHFMEDALQMILDEYGGS